MLELKALLLTQGMHGMVSQVEGLAKALGLSYKHQKIELKSFWNFITKTCRKIYLNYFYRWPPDTYQGYLNTNNLRIKNQECSICL